MKKVRKPVTIYTPPDKKDKISDDKQIQAIYEKLVEKYGEALKKLAKH